MLRRHRVSLFLRQLLGLNVGVHGIRHVRSQNASSLNSSGVHERHSTVDVLSMKKLVDVGAVTESIS